MIKLNPKIKIAGIELSEAIKSFSDSRKGKSPFKKIEIQEKEGCINIEEVL